MIIDRNIFINRIARIILSWVTVVFLFSAQASFAIDIDENDKDLYAAIENLSSFIASDYFREIKNKNTDLELIDTIYIRAVDYMDNDYSEAMLALTFTLLPYNKLPLTIPLLDIDVYAPLPSASLAVFEMKNENLPTIVFFDSPLGKTGDRDKLAHFFGNAFLSYNIGFFNLSKFLGIFVELFEEAFSISGSLDYRDITANHLGELFGKALNENESLLPSEVLSIYSLLFFKHLN